MTAVLYRLPTDPEVEEYVFDCPGCNRLHFFRVKGRGMLWEWNGSLVKPTVTPAIYTGTLTARCNLVIREGRLIFLPDSCHNLAGKIVEMTPIARN